MLKRYHILNGDSLKEQFPADLPGDIIVLRECLMDGPVHGKTPDEFYTVRAKFISKLDSDISESAYYDKTVPELEKIPAIPDNSDVTLWFEDDLFCQVNFWFATSLLFQKNIQLFLVRPPHHNRYGFGGLDTAALKVAFKERFTITETGKIAQLWEAYKANDSTNLLQLAGELESKYPFIKNAVQAHIDRQPQGDFPGRPKASLKTIMTELQTNNFGTIFQEFCKRESIYGYGDLQVKRLFDEVVAEGDSG
ncbi:DUF1835 domain-containing protein [Fulvivirga ulvae]|uniref:DUF1835 domain-containing protein n=1 Tax=Fulvivirga ulvae TaxID=2904245 RepID=UPI001F1F9A3B|nr:DUF1835 domain-containing protein [Fulvivirga ulvae]UII32573.1 DUF1835 domain-containing protein [Fulvivirga ulvae]